MRTTRKPKTIQVGPFRVKVIRGKYGEYRYLSPRYGYKMAYRYDAVAYVYDDTGGEEECVERLWSKGLNLKKIEAQVEEFHGSAKYQRHLNMKARMEARDR